MAFDQCGTCGSSCSSCTHDFNPLLAGIDISDRERLDESRTTLTYKKGEVLFKKGTFPAGLFCLNSGKVMITASDSNGNTIAVNLSNGVTFLGVSDFLSGLPYQHTCVALSDVKVCLIKGNSMEELISNNIAFARRLIETLARDNQQRSRRLLALTKKNMNARLADALLELLDVFGTNDEKCIDVYLKRSEIAQICNMSETNVIRQLSSLDKQGIVKLFGKQIRILSKERLESESMGLVMK